MTVLDMSLGGGVLIAAILVLRRGLLYRLPKWTFLLLWAVALCRLLIPAAVPSPFSVQTGAAWVVQLLEKEKISAPVSEPEAPAPSAPVTSPGIRDIPVVPTSPAPAPVPLPEAKAVSPLKIIRLTGTALCGLFFAAAYLWSWRRFQDAVPAESDVIRRWQAAHPARFPVRIRICGAVNAPLAYGLLRPVVLLPGDTDWSDENQLNYVLTHEYIHVRRGDLLWKLLLTAALCVHWFNPLVWIMYLRANQDLELACDEAVVRTLGLDSRKEYAYALLAAAESGFSPLCITYATKNHMEERIRAIMKIKKRSTAVIICAALLVAGVSAVFATSSKPAGPKDLEDLPPAVMTPAAPNPAPAPAEKDVSKNTPERVHPITSSPQPAPTDPDTSAAPPPAPGVPGQDTEPVQQPVEPAEPAVEPVRDTAEPQQPAQPEPAAPPLENRWGVPDGELPMFTEFLVESFEDADELGKYLEATHGLYPEDYSAGCTHLRNAADLDLFLQRESNPVFRDYALSHTLPMQIYSLQVNYYERTARNERLIDGAYPVNSKGETYGVGYDSIIVGYLPDLIATNASIGEDGYAVERDYFLGGYQGPTNTPEDWDAYLEWQKAQPNPRLIPLYDVEHETVVGYYEYRISSKSDMDAEYGITPDMSLEEARERIANGPLGEAD